MFEKKCGRDFAIIVRISGDDYEAGGQSLHEGCYIAKRLEAAQVDMIHVSGGNYYPPRQTQLHPLEHHKRVILTAHEK